MRERALSLMRRLLVLLAAAAIAWWVVDGRSPPSAEPEPEPEQGRDADAIAPPHPSLRATGPAATSVGVLRGRVYRGGRAVPATIQIHALPKDRWLGEFSSFDDQSTGTRVEATAEDGFAWAPPRAGRYRVRAGRAPGTVSVLVSLEEGASPKPLTLVLPDGPHACRVRLVDTEGRPALLPVLATGSAASTGRPTHALGPFRPDADGRLIIPGLEAGEVRLGVRLGPLEEFTSAPYAIPREDEVRIVVPTVARTLRVRIVDAYDDAAVPGCGVRVSVATAAGGSWWTSFDAGAAGSKTVRCPAGPGRIAVRTEGYKFHAYTFAAADTEAVVRLLAHTRLQGHVLDAATGKPAAGAVVHVFPVDDGDVEAASPFGGSSESATSEDGTFSISHERLAQAMVCVHGGGWVSADLRALAEPGVNPFILVDAFREGRDLTLRAVRAPALRVRVVDEQGTPVAGCPVQLEQGVWAPGRGHGHPLDEAAPLSSLKSSGDDGWVQFETLVPGWNYQLYVPYDVAWRLASGDAQGFEVEGMTLPDRTLVVKPNPEYEAPPADVTPAEALPERAPLRVEIQDGGGQPLRGAGVLPYAKPSGGTVLPPGYGVRTGADGSVELRGLPATDVYVEVRRPGYVTPPRTRAGAAAPSLTIQMAKGLYITGVAHNADGSVVTDALVQAHPAAHGGGHRTYRSVARWEGKGRFRAGPLEAGTYRLSFFRMIDGRAHRAGVMADAGDDGLAVRLTPDPLDTGRGLVVRAPDGSIVQAYTTLHLTQGRDGRQGSLMYGTYRGRASLHGPGRRRTWIDITRAAPGTRGSLPLAAARIGPFEKGKIPKTFELILTAEQPIEGRVVDEQGTAVAGVRIDAYARPPEGVNRGYVGWTHSETWTRSDGSFRIGRLGALPYDLQIHAPPHLLPRIVEDLRGGSSGHVLVLTSAQEADIRVVDEAGRAVEGAAVWVVAEKKAAYPSNDDPWRGPHKVRTDAHGTARLGRLEAGARYKLTAEPPSPRKDLRSRRVTGWSPADTTVALQAKSTITGAVRDMQGRPLADVRIRAHSVDPASDKGGGHRGRTQEDGTFRVFGPAAGAVRLDLRVPGLPQKLVRSVMAPASGVVLTVDMGASLTLTVPQWPRGVDDCSYTVAEGAQGDKPIRRWTGRIERGQEAVLRGIDPHRIHAIHATCFPDDGVLVAYDPALPAGTARAPLAFQVGRVLMVRVEAPAGVDVRGTRLRIEDGAIRLNTRTDSSGTSGWRVLPEGRFRVEAELKTAKGLLTGHADVAAGETGRIVLQPAR